MLCGRLSQIFRSHPLLPGCRYIAVGMRPNMRGAVENDTQCVLNMDWMWIDNISLIFPDIYKAKDNTNANGFRRRSNQERGVHRKVSTVMCQISHLARTAAFLASPQPSGASASVRQTCLRAGQLQLCLHNRYAFLRAGNTGACNTGVTPLPHSYGEGGGEKSIRVLNKIAWISQFNVATQHIIILLT